MGPMSNRFKVQIYFYGLTIEINNFTFEVKVIPGMESTRIDESVAKIKSNDPQDKDISMV